MIMEKEVLHSLIDATSTSFGASTVLGSRHTAVKKERNPCSSGAYILVRKTANKQAAKIHMMSNGGKCYE